MYYFHYCTPTGYEFVNLIHTFLTNQLDDGHVVELEIGKTIEWRVSDISNSGNPICRNGSWEADVVIITRDDATYETGEKIEFVIKKKEGGHYQALLKEESPVSKPNYGSTPNIPIHHDGKHGQSVGDTRSEGHAMKDPKDRY